MCASICACHLFLIISPPSWLLKLGDYSVVRVGWRWKWFYSENLLYQIQHFCTPFPGHGFLSPSGRVYHCLCRQNFQTRSVTIFCFLLCFALLYLLLDQLFSFSPVRPLPDLLSCASAILMALAAARLAEFQQYWQISASGSFFFPFLSSIHQRQSWMFEDVVGSSWVCSRFSAMSCKSCLQCLFLKGRADQLIQRGVIKPKNVTAG